MKLADPTPFSVGDTVVVRARGMREVAQIASFVDGNTVRLNHKLQGKYEGTAYLCKQTTGLSIEAASPGNWGDRLTVVIVPRTAVAPITKFDLRVTLAPGPDQTQPPESEVFLNLSTGRGKDLRYAPEIVGDRDVGSSLIRLTMHEGFEGFASGDPISLTLEGGRNGLSPVTHQDFIGSDDHLRGLRVLEEIDEVGILLAPDAVNAGRRPAPQPPVPAPDPCQPKSNVPEAPATVADDPTARLGSNGIDSTQLIYQAMLDQARRLRYRVAVLDTPDKLEPGAVAHWVASLGLEEDAAPFAAVYYPWIMVPDGLTGEPQHPPHSPSGHVAGVFAQVTIPRRSFAGQRRARVRGRRRQAGRAAPAGTVERERHKCHPLFPGRIRIWGRARSIQ